MLVSVPSHLSDAYQCDVVVAQSECYGLIVLQERAVGEDLPSAPRFSVGLRSQVTSTKVEFMGSHIS